MTLFTSVEQVKLLSLHIDAYISHANFRVSLKAFPGSCGLEWRMFIVAFLVLISLNREEPSHPNQWSKCIRPKSVEAN